MFILRQHQVQYISGTVPTGAAKYKHGIGNIGPEYTYSAATRSAEYIAGVHRTQQTISCPVNQTTNERQNALKSAVFSQ